jgi:hypothetical protein
MHLVSDAVTPQVIRGQAFLMLDVGEAPVRLSRTRQGLAALYGRDVNIDPREVSAFVRNLSCVDADASLPSGPSFVGAFPAALRNPALLYSGVYEDGWVSERSYWRLYGAGSLVVAGVVPEITDASFTTRVSLSVDGKMMAEQDVGPGEFKITAPVPDNRSHSIDLAFSRAQTLPGADGRIVGALLREISISPSAK